MFALVCNLVTMPQHYRYHYHSQSKYPHNSHCSFYALKWSFLVHQVCPGHKLLLSAARLLNTESATAFREDEDDKEDADHG